MSAVAQTSLRQDANVLSGEPPATPAQFLRWLHGDLRHRICVVSRIELADEPGAVTFRDHTIHRDDLPWQLQCPDVWLDSPDTYVMINETRRQRLASDVVCLKAFVVDLDCHQADDLEPEAARDQALARLDAAGLPRPHLCVETGRGMQLIWRLGRVGLKKAHRNAQVRWAKTQQALAKICGPQADLSLVDLPRVIRLPGTVNTKATPARRVTRSSWVAGASAADYSFDELCDAALGVKRRAFVAAYVRKQADNDEAPITTTATAAAVTKPVRKPRSAASGTAGFESLATIAAARLRDLEKIAERFFMSGIPEGYRDIFIMAVATDLSWVTPLQQADAFGDQVVHRLKIMGAVVDERTHGAYLGRINAPLSLTEARRNLGSVVQRFRDAAAGAKVEFGGQLRDPRYWYGTDRKWSLIGPMIVDDHELLGRLEELLPRHLRQTRQARRRGAGDSAVASDGETGDKAAQAARNRVAEGRYKRARPTNAQRDQALAALDSGLDLKAAADLAGVTTRTIYNWMARRAEATGRGAGRVGVGVRGRAARCGQRRLLPARARSCLACRARRTTSPAAEALRVASLRLSPRSWRLWPVRVACRSGPTGASAERRTKSARQAHRARSRSSRPAQETQPPPAPMALRSCRQVPRTTRTSGRPIRTTDEVRAFGNHRAGCLPASNGVPPP